MRWHSTHYAKRWLIQSSLPKTFIIILLVLLTLLSERYTSYLIDKLAASEKAKVDLFVATTIAKLRTNDIELIRFLYGVVDNYTHIPMIATDAYGHIIGYNGLKKNKTPFIEEANKNLEYDPKYFQDQLLIMKKQHKPIIYAPSANNLNYVYYRDSFLLYNLKYFPIIQFLSTLIFLIIAYLLFRTSEKAEQNLLWVGMAKETAHQLGTPISSIMAWVKLLKDNSHDIKSISKELENDALHLKHISDRFSEIGLNPKLKLHNIFTVIEQTINYIKVRTPKKISYSLIGEKEAYVFLNVELFKWVIENVIKNSINAIGAKEGEISICIQQVKNKIHIYIKDNGNGIAKKNFEKIFQAGFSTKTYGWGLGLSLARRIIEIYHQGLIFVYSSIVNKGTTFVIILSKAN